LSAECTASAANRKKYSIAGDEGIGNLELVIGYALVGILLDVHSENPIPF